MKTSESHFFLKIRKRPWYIWLIRLIWLAWLVFWAEVSIGAWKEFEARAFVIALGIFLISLFLGILIWLLGNRRIRA